ncbi:MAG: J domain-containing protein [Pseudomonadota bacterium]|nr:J domain-containing protein [Pseudomonadota bacterium]
MRRARTFSAPDTDTASPVRCCDHPECVQAGEYRAPKSRDRLREYYWFCLDHVRAYNRAWDWYAGMSQEQVEAHIQLDMVWERPAWPLGSWAAEGLLRERVFREFRSGDDAGFHSRKESAPDPASRQEQKALSVLDLVRPVTFARIRARYLQLVKQHHPDANGGDTKTEEILKAVNEAYTFLKSVYGTSG